MFSFHKVKYSPTVEVMGVTAPSDQSSLQETIAQYEEKHFLLFVKELEDVSFQREYGIMASCNKYSKVIYNCRLCSYGFF